MHRMVRVGLWIAGAVVAVLFIKVMLAHYGMGRHWGSGGVGQFTPALLPPAPASDRHARVADSLTLEVRPRAGRFDSLFVADLVIANRSAAAVFDVAVGCDAVGMNGDTTGRAATRLHDVVAAHSTATAANVGFRFTHRPESARCVITDFSIGP